MTGLIVALCVTLPLIGFFVMLVYLRRIENAERMAMIDKGLDPTFFATKKKGGSSATLRVALLLIGVGLGILGGFILDKITTTGLHMGGNPVPYFMMIFIFGGLGLLSAYLIEEKKHKASGN